MHDPEFRRFWFGQTVSLFGAQVTLLALPLTAVLVLHASPFEMGLLGAVAFVPYLVLALPAGAWIDRRRRRPILVAANLLRAGIIGVVPVAALFHALSYPILLAVALLSGICAVFFEVAYPAYLPSLVGRERLTTANARIVTSSSVASVGGPGLGGLLVSILGAPFALTLDAVTYLLSGVAFASIRRPEPEPGSPSTSSPFLDSDRSTGSTSAPMTRRPLRLEILEGLQATFGNPILRTFALEAATYNLFASALQAVFLIFAIQELGLGPATVGSLFTVGALGALGGALVAGRMADRLGLGRTIVIVMFVACLPYLGMAFIGGPQPLVLVMLAAIFAIEGAGVSVSVIHVMTIRQSMTPDHLLARMNASYRTIGYGAVALGSLLGGLLGETIGLRPTLLVAGLGIAAAPLWIVASPVRGIRRLTDLLGEAPMPAAGPRVVVGSTLIGSQVTPEIRPAAN